MTITPNPRMIPGPRGQTLPDKLWPISPKALNDTIFTALIGRRTDEYAIDPRVFQLSTVRKALLPAHSQVLYHRPPAIRRVLGRHLRPNLGCPRILSRLFKSWNRLSSGGQSRDIGSDRGHHSRISRSPPQQKLHTLHYRPKAGYFAIVL